MFLNIPVSTEWEIENNPVSSFIVRWYKARYPEDEIAFVSDIYDDWPFDTGSRGVLEGYPDVTKRVLDILIKEGHVVDNGIEWQDDDEPETVFIRDLALANK